MTIEYRLLRRQLVPISALSRLTRSTVLFALDGSRRSQLLLLERTVGRRVCALVGQYGFSQHEADDFEAQFPGVEFVWVPDLDEGSVTTTLVNALGSVDPRRFVIDITGFPRQHVMCIVGRLISLGWNGFRAMYAEPTAYVHEEDTVFSGEGQVTVRPVRGLEGSYRVGKAETLVIGTGYEVDLMQAVAYSRPRATKKLLFGLPPLQLTMYQENILQAMLASDAVEGTGKSDRLFAAAYCPFETAQVITDCVTRGARKGENTFLAPLGTKVQALGFTLAYMYEFSGQTATMLTAATAKVRRGTALGVGRIWFFEIARLQ